MCVCVCVCVCVCYGPLFKRSVVSVIPQIDLYALPTGCDTPLGLSLGTVEDTSLTASSQLDTAHSPAAGRLLSPRAWCADPSDSEPFFQVRCIAEELTECVESLA